MNDNPMTAQVGGDHYRRMMIQPIEMTMCNRYDPCIHSIVKYVSRWRSKGGFDDLRKAQHFADLRVAVMLRSEFDGFPDVFERISVTHYCAMNDIGEAEESIFRLAHEWARIRDMRPDLHQNFADRIKARIDGLMRQHGKPTAI